ncbi:MAG: tRNA (adenosine(37)-N6)-dimethylallyltransferase MiaA [Crocinitomicaceae bacterium]|nr:tRNA (adenosine(37)-N6)-dimethylallyltransferase MiaA [Crocinitomicaceae bacterium]
MSLKKSPILAIVGPTASGKTQLACAVAAEMEGEIISGDSRQIYRFMDIGTGKDLSEYVVNGKQIPYHLIDIKDPGYRYNIAEFQEDFLRVFSEIESRNHIPILCGGSGLYLETALRGNSFLGIESDPSFYEKMKDIPLEEIEKEISELPHEIKSKLTVQTWHRKIRAIEIGRFLKANPDWKPTENPGFTEVIIGMDISREQRRDKITKRLSERLNNGLYEEVEALLKRNVSFEDLEYYGLEYKWLGLFLKNEISKKELFEGLNIAIHQFAKRQMTWFRKMENDGYKINWLDVNLPLAERVKKVKEIYISQTA